MIRGKLTYLFWFAAALWGSIFFASLVPRVIFLLAGFIFAAFSVPLLDCKVSRSRRSGLALLFVGLGFVVGFLRSPEALHGFAEPAHGGLSAYTAVRPERVTSFAGILKEDSSSTPNPSGKTTRYSVRLEQVVSAHPPVRAEAAASVLVLAADGPVLFRGREITVVSSLHRNREPGAYDYISRAKPDQIYAGEYRQRLHRRRAAVLSELHVRFQQLEPETAVLAEALLLGRREEIDPVLYERFRRSGSLHLLALSGLHLGILYGFVYLVFRFLRKRIRTIVASSAMLFYLFLVGWRPSLERATAMLLITAVGFSLDRELQPLNILSLAAALLVIARPYYAFDLSFQLSFLALLGILLAGPYLFRIFQPYLPAFIGWPLAISLGAQIGTAPILLAYFGVLYPVGVPAAVLLIPLVTLFLGAGLVFFLLSAVSFPLISWIARVVELVYRCIVLALDLFSRAPALYIHWRSWYWLFFVVLLIPPLIELSPRRQAC